MKLDNMFKKTRRPSGKKGHIGGKHQSPEVPEGLLCKCNKCQKAIITEDVITGGYICPKCHGYFRMPAPEGYRKALRLMKQAEKFHRPVICFVDTPGAFCGISAEERGQGEAIARNLYEMSALKTPILSIVIGEGGSGGALAMAVSDQVWMLENSIYSILSPEGFASILWKDSTKAAQAAKVMRLTAADLKEMGIVEKVFAEPEHFTAETMNDIADELEKNIEGYLEEYTNKDIQELVDSRYERFRRM